MNLPIVKKLVHGIPIQIDAQGMMWIDSLTVASRFEKEHRNVLQAIRELGVEEEFGLLNFQQSSYINEQNKSQPCYRMTRDGFALLAMGFTGEAAMKWKVIFIKAFNAMEQVLIANLPAVQKAGEVFELKARMDDVEYKQQDQLAVQKNHEKRLRLVEDHQRKPFTDETKQRYLRVLLKFTGGRCPATGEMLVDLEGKWLPCVVCDHWRQRSDNRPQNGWPVHTEVNAMALEKKRDMYQQKFDAFQQNYRELYPDPPPREQLPFKFY